MNNKYNAFCLDDYSNLGSFIKKIRKRKGITQRQLVRGDSIENRICSEKTLSRIENGEVDLSDRLLRDFLSVLGMNFTEFFYEVEGGVETTVFLNSFNEAWDLQGDEGIA